MIFGRLADRYGRRRVLTWTIWVAYALAVFITGAVSDWRIAFAIGALPVVAAVWIRRRCPESRQWEAFRDDQLARQAKNRVDVRALLRSNIGILIVGTLVVFGGQYSYYVYSSWMPTYLKNDLSITPDHAQMVLYVSAAISFVSYNLAGWLSDFLGRRTTLLMFASVELVAFGAFAVLDFMGSAQGWVVLAYFGISFGLGYFAIFGTWFGELFPTPIRATASSFCYSVGRGFAGFGPAIVAALATTYGLGGGISTGVIAVVLTMGFAAILRDRAGRAITASE
nr:MFS transporter [Rhodococcus sp. 06-621-2]